MKNGQRIGIWEYYDTPLKLALKVDYDNGRLLYIEPDTSDFVILEADKWVRRKLDVPSRTHGSIHHLLNHFGRFGWTYKAVEGVRKNTNPLHVDLVFEVRHDGMAQNPVVIGDSGEGVKEALLHVFEEAPPWWIVGTTKGGTAAICRFAFCYSLGFDSDVEVQHTTEARIIQKYKVLARGVTHRNSLLSNMSEINGLQFSPNSQRLLIDLPSLYLDTVSALHQPIITDLSPHVIDRIRFGVNNGAWWLNDNEILFCYTYARLSPLLAHYDLRTGSIKPLTDSATFNHILSQDLKQMVFVRPDKDKSLRLWIHNFRSGESRVLIGPLLKGIRPTSWSPDGSLLVIEEWTEEGNSGKVLLNVKNLERKTLPLLEGDVAGWSADSKTVYFAKTKFGDYELLGNLYAISAETGRHIEVGSRMKGLYQATFNGPRNSFAVNIKNKIYFVRPEPGAEPVFRFDDARQFAWYPDGSGIVYQKNEDMQVYLWTESTRTHKQLTFGELPAWSRKSKKKKN